MKKYPILAIVFALSSAAFAAEAILIKDDRLENAHRLTDKVITGAEPHGEKAMQALKDLGIKSILTVDGAKPDVEMARKYGMRYVHLPIGYDGVPAERSKEIAKAFEELEGPIYLHCHHGKHRGPAAAVTACVVAGWLTNDEAIAAMKKLGTGENYLGLWDSARTAKTLPAADLAKFKVEYRESSPIPPIAEAMVHVDEAFEHLGEAKKAGWKQPKDHPDIDPPHEALKLREIYFELMRTEEFKARPDDYRGWMTSSLEHSKKLETLLAAYKKDNTLSTQEIDKTYTAIQADCKSCHSTYRNKKKAP